MSETANISIFQAYLAISITIIFSGLSISFVEFGLKYFNPFTFLFLRFFIATIILTPIILLKKLNSVKQLVKNKWTWFVGLSVSFGLVFQYLGQQEKYGVPGGLASLLSLMFLIIVPFISPIIVNEKITIYHMIAVVFGLIGIYFIVTEGKPGKLIGGSIVGVSFLLGTAICYAFYIVTTSRLTTIETLNVDTFSLFYITLVITTIVSFFPSLIYDNIRLTNKLDGYIWLSLLIIFPTILGFYMYFRALKRISANIVSVISLIQILFPFAIDYIFLGERYSKFILLGSLFIIVAMIIVVCVPLFKNK